MSVVTPICPVCGMTLKATGVNPNMYYCTKRKVWVSDLNIHYDTVDSTVFVAPDGRQTLKIIEIPPYKFIITDEEKIQKTVVHKMMAPDTIPWQRSSTHTVNKKVILTVNTVMKLPWNNKEKVHEKVKLYLLFS